MNKPKEDIEVDVDVEDVIRQIAIDNIVTEDELKMSEFSSLDDSDLVEDRYVDDEEDYNEIDLDAFFIGGLMPDLRLEALLLFTLMCAFYTSV